MDIAGDPAETVTLVGIRDAVGPVGDTDAPRLIVPVNPCSLLMVMVDVLDELCPIVSEDGFDAIEKPGCTMKVPSMLVGWTVQ